MLSIEFIAAGLGIFLIGGILASKIAVKTGVPALLLFLGIGMLAGSDGPGGIHFDYPILAQSIGVVALAFILFSGGLDTNWTHVRPILHHGVILATIGVGITALSVGLFINLVLGFSLAEGVLLGSIIASTDAAAVFGILRGRSIRLRGELKPLLELESGSNDPMAVFLTVGMIQILANPTLSPLALVPMFVLQMGIGFVAGVVMGQIAISLINWLSLEYDGLYPVLTIALVLIIYSTTAFIGGNGFLAVYVAGVTMARRDFVHKRSLRQFHDGVSWLMQIIMFLSLGLQVYPSRLGTVAVDALMVAAFLSFVARPLSVFLALSYARIELRKKIFISWVGLRGAAPIVLATFPLLAGIEKADTMFHMVFFIVLASVLVQGSLIIPAAKFLRVYDDSEEVKSPMNEVMSDASISNDLLELTVAPNSPVEGRQIVELGLPASVLVIMLGRANDLIVPRGDTRFQQGDKVLLLLTPETRGLVQTLFSPVITDASLTGNVSTL